MRSRNWFLLGFSAAAAAVAANLLWNRSQRKIGELPPLPKGHARRMLELVAPLIRLPTSPGQEPKVLVDGGGLLCPETGLVYPYRGRVLHFVPVAWLGEQLSKVGYTDYVWSIPGGWFGYTSARKAAQRES